MHYSPSRLLICLLSFASLCLGVSIVGCWSSSKPDGATPIVDFKEEEAKFQARIKAWQATAPRVDPEAVQKLAPADIAGLSQRVSGFTNLMQQVNCGVTISVDLSDCNVTDADLARMTFPPEVESINISNTGITDEGVASLVGLKQLKKLGLGGTKVSDRVTAILKKMPGLINVDLMSTQVPDATLAALNQELAAKAEGLEGSPSTAAGQNVDISAVQAAMRQGAQEVDQYADVVSKFGGRLNLRLNFVKQPITDADIQQLTIPDCVRTIDLSYTKVTGQSFPKLREAKGLEVLSLVGTQINDADVETLVQFPLLIQINLERTGVSFESQMKLVRAMAPRRAKALRRP